jgi:hypothetical protein
MQQLTSYYHPDRNHNEFANSIMQEINRLKGDMKAGRNIRKELEALAQNPP